MTLSTSFHEDSVAVQEELSQADEVLARIAAMVVKNPLASNLEERAIVKSLKEREALGSTGLGNGVAVPHCTADGLDDFVIGLLTLSKPTEFRSLDGAPADIFFFIVGPREQRNRHIKLLSAFSKLATGEGAIDQLRSFTDPARAREYLIEGIDYDDEPVSTEKVLFTIFLQKLDYFEDVLSLLSSTISGSIAVLETRNAGAYLFRMPLFAAFWSESAQQDGRVVLAVAEKRATNSIIRQIQEITGDPGEQTGIMITVQDLSYAAGSLDF